MESLYVRRSGNEFPGPANAHRSTALDLPEAGTAGGQLGWLGRRRPGCSSSQWAQVRRIPRNPLTKTLKLDSRSGPQPTDRTLQTLRQYDLLSLVDYPEEAWLPSNGLPTRNPRPIIPYAIAEIAYIGTKKREAVGQWALALDLFGTAVANSYVFLFEQSFTHDRNPYDPRFRRACDLYNASLESALRYLQRGGCLRPGATAHDANRFSDVRCAGRQPRYLARRTLPRSQVRLGF